MIVFLSSWALHNKWTFKVLSRGRCEGGVPVIGVKKFSPTCFYYVNSGLFISDSQMND